MCDIVWHGDGAELYRPERQNSRGLDLHSEAVLKPLAEAMAEAASEDWRAAPIVSGVERSGKGEPVRDPLDTMRYAGGRGRASRGPQASKGQNAQRPRPA